MATNLSSINFAALSGPIGATGISGATGFTGTTGPQGSTGLTGATGERGVTGNTGPNGVQGATGIGFIVLTSTTSQTIGTGVKTFTVNLDATQSAYPVGGRVRVYSQATPSFFMEGPITGYTGITMLINFDFLNGTGTYADWRITLASNPGSTGPKLVGTISSATPSSTVGYVNGDLWFKV
jgi:hypothetical protein